MKARIFSLFVKRGGYCLTTHPQALRWITSFKCPIGILLATPKPPTDRRVYPPTVEENPGTACPAAEHVGEHDTSLCGLVHFR